ncbi:hypothetical protein [Brevibacillus laterosporus]
MAESLTFTSLGELIKEKEKNLELLYRNYQEERGLVKALFQK